MKPASTRAARPLKPADYLKKILTARVYDVVLILRRGRHDVRGCTVTLTSERAETDPKVFLKIHMQFTITGKGIPAAAVERAIAMSHEKYCSASIMLGKTAAITTGFTLVEA